MLKILERIMVGKGRMSDIPLVSVAENIEGNTICALGDAAAWPGKMDSKKIQERF